MDDPDNVDEMKRLDPHITAIMFEQAQLGTPDAFEKQKYYWLGWHNEAGQGHQDYDEFVKLSNKAAQANGYDDTGHMWRQWYDDDNFKDSMETLWKEIEPFYVKLHGYIRYKLRQAYG